MKAKDNVKFAGGGSWYRCQRVAFVGDTAKWELSRSGRYGLLEAYKSAPHEQLIRSRDDASLETFIREWGPLRMSPPKSWSGSDPISDYRAVRDSLTAWTRFLAAIEDPEYLRDSIGKLLRTGSLHLGYIRHRLNLPGGFRDLWDEELEKRIDAASEGELDDVCGYIIGLLPHPALSASFAIAREKKTRTVRAISGIDSLNMALYWMVWQDYFLRDPWQICEDYKCHWVFKPRTKHVTKFCTYECAHRKASRESARRPPDRKGKKEE